MIGCTQANKISANCSAKLQPADVGPCFITLHTLFTYGTYQEYINSGIVQFLEKELTSEATKKKFSIPAGVRKQLVDMVAQLPTIMSHCFHPTNVQLSYAKAYMVPFDLKGMLSLCRKWQSFSTEQGKQILDAMVQDDGVIDLVAKNGQVTEEEFDRLGFPAAESTRGQGEKQREVHDQRPDRVPVPSHVPYTRRPPGDASSGEEGAR